MDFLQDLLYRLNDTGVLDALPPALRQPPGVWVVLGLAALGLLIACALVGRMLFGGAAPRRVEQSVRRQIRSDLAEMRRLGNHRGVGELYEDLGQFKKALAAYKKGDLGEERAALLVKLGKRREAKSVARDAGVWRLYAEICQEDGELEEAAVAFERDAQAYLAARCYEAAKRPIDAARCYVAAGMEAQAVGQLADQEGPEVADLLDRALRSSIGATGPSGLSLELSQAVRRTVQLWLSAGEARRAFELAVLADQLKLAVPVARDYLEPTAEAAEVCERAGAPIVAAELWRKVGEPRRADLLLAEYHRDRGEAAQAAEHYENAESFSDAAEQWAAAGDIAKAAELFRRGGDLHSAAQLYAEGGDTARSQELLSHAHALSVEGHFEADVTSRFAGQAPPPTPDFRGAQGPTRAAVPRASPPTPVARGPQGTIVATPNPTGPSPTVPAEPAFTVPAPASPESPRPGKRDSNERYQILEELGRGGMGVVYRAEDRMLQREVAYKVLPENILGAEITPESLLAEARAAARLSHPNIVQVYDAGRKGQGFFIVMELVRGETLEALLTKRAMSIRGVIQVGRQVLAALAHAHERRLIHRDLKPSNLIWGDDNRIKLSDFGLARAFEATVGNVRTQPAGTPSYMSPEQIRGEPVSPSTDLYAFGCVLWEMLCRQPVFGTGAPSFHHHLSSSPRDPREVRADIPEPLAALVLQCLAKSSGERPSSAVELAQRLAEMLPPKA